MRVQQAQPCVALQRTQDRHVQPIQLGCLGSGSLHVVFRSLSKGLATLGGWVNFLQIVPHEGYCFFAFQLKQENLPI
jgi:hypothetical protein